jgi:hypothetical protein
LFSDISDPNVQVVAARENNAYKNADLQRTIYMLRLPGGKKVIVDVFNAISTEKAQFDLPFQYNGQLISTSFKYNYSEKIQEPFGKNNGYQFLWKEGEASVKDTMAQFTFLNNRTYYTISSLIDGTASLFFTRTGANDPNFNLRREPAFIIRKNGSGQSFISVIEIHGKFDPVIEFSTNSYSSVQNMKLLENDDYSVIEIIVNGKKILIAQSNKDYNKTTKHSAKEISWAGPFTVLYDGKILK